MSSAPIRPTPIEKTSEPELGSEPIPKQRYLSREFAQREWERMWTRVWLLAGAERDVAHPGDWFTFDIGPESILVARDRRGTLHAHAERARESAMVSPWLVSVGGGWW